MLLATGTRMVHLRIPTIFDPDDLYNLAEAAAVTTINNDAWLGSTANIALVHQKVRLGDNALGFYTADELPAIGVMAGGGAGDDKIGVQQFEHQITLALDIWVFDAELDAADTTCKTIMARLRQLLRTQTFSPSVNTNSTQLDGFLGDGDLDLTEHDFLYFEDPDAGGWLVNGQTTALLHIISEE